MKKFTSIIAIVLIISIVLCGCKDGNGTVSIDFLDVGNADCIIIKTKHNVIMIDTAEETSFCSVSRYLKKKGITDIDYLILTHFDTDHLGGAVQIMNNYNVGKIYQTYYSDKRSKILKNYKKALKSTGIVPNVVRCPQLLSVDGIRITVYPPKKRKYKTNQSNNSSLVCGLKCGKYGVLFAADIEEERICEILESGELENYDILKMPHHGFYEDSTRAFLSAVKPTYAVVTSDESCNTTYATLELLYSIGCTVYKTGAGTVKLRIKPYSVSFYQ